ncbi:MAG: FG-GAP repeat protein, partial [Ignavibacteria bacterium]|nr:FG-GAP repeat protein [Ignavibacteria bacterium]
TSESWTAEGNQDYADFGSSVSSAGDVNGDGYSDVIVGLSGYDNGQTDEGTAFVYYGGFFASVISSNPRQFKPGSNNVVSSGM